MQVGSLEYNAAKLCLAKLLRGDDPGALPDEKVLLKAAQAEGVTALCHDHLRHSPIWEACSESLRASLTQITYQEAALEMLRAEELRKVLALLAEHGLPVLILKGAALAYTLYPKPHLRSRCDTDLLLPSREEAERVWQLLQLLGYQRIEPIPGNLINYEFTCYKFDSRKLTYTLDIHWRVSNSTLFAERFTFNELFNDSLPVLTMGPHAYCLSLHHAFLLAAMHRFLNIHMGTANRLIWLNDIHKLTQLCNEKCWKQIIALAKERSLCGPCLNTLRNAQEWLATYLPDAILDELQTGANREGFNPRHASTRWSLELLTFRKLPSNLIRLRWLIQHLFPATACIHNRYSFRYSFLLPWFYSVRIIRFFWKIIFHKPIAS